MKPLECHRKLNDDNANKEISHIILKKKDNCENMNLTAKIEAGKNITATERSVHCTTEKYIEN